MATIPIRADNAYIALGKQSGQGSIQVPNVFPRWLDGSKIEFDLAAGDVWEGDGSRHLSQVIKNRQLVKIKIVVNPRPVELGFFEAAAMGSGADALTAATVATTLSALTSAGATSITVAANTGLTGSGTIALVLEPGTATEEVALFNIPATGVGPYTLTVNTAYNGGALKLAHANAGVVRSATTHTLTDQIDGNYYTVDVCLGALNSGAGVTLRVRDCKVDQIKRSGKAGSLLTYEIDLIGIATTSVTVGTPTYENRQAFLFATGTWTINGLTTGDALTIEQFDITQKNNLDTIQTEALVLAAILFGNINVDAAFDFVMQNANFINLVYFGSTSGAADNQVIGSGSLNVVFAQPDAFHNVTFNLPTLHYGKAEPPQPKKDGKHYKISVSGASVSNQSQNLNIIQTTLTNVQTTAY